MGAVVRPGAELESAVLLPPKVVEIGARAHGLHVAFGDDKNLAIRIEEGIS